MDVTAPWSDGRYGLVLVDEALLCHRVEVVAQWRRHGGICAATKSTKMVQARRLTVPVLVRRLAVGKGAGG